MPWKVFLDKEGRYVAIEITYDNKKILILNMYAPNGSKNNFEEIQKQLDITPYENLIVLGDLNGTIDYTIDRSTDKMKKKMKNGKLPNSFFIMIENEKLIDVWRDKNKGVKEYTFYSNRHHSWSRIDMMWATKELSLKTGKVEILPRTLSKFGILKEIWIK